MNTLKLRNLLFKFDNKENYFFNNFSFDISTGLTFIKGSNGSGKSTLFRLITGNIDPTEIISGSIVLNNKIYDLESKSDRLELSSKIMLIPQNYNEMLADKFTGLENLQFAKFAKYPKLNFYSSKINNLSILENFGIPLDKPVSLLSGGQKQILSIFMALEKNPNVVLLDEPTATLDDNNAKIVMTFLKNLISKNNIIVLCICHDQNIIEMHQDKSFEINKRL